MHTRSGFTLLELAILLLVLGLLVGGILKWQEGAGQASQAVSTSAR
ncbi:MAG TPA: hypothetical protein PKH69_05895 [Thiobacillaceae bacterium]|nr:hypothetical protein [Thiobacillaceae bacterium]HNU64239.1 hypothetical protein [Thiobacillaceae bacterium]